MSSLDGSDLRGAAACISDAQSSIATAKEYLANVMDNMERYTAELDKLVDPDKEHPEARMIRTYRSSLENVKTYLDQASDL